MNKSVKKAIENADDVIEKFGGIRPMSTKTNIPVTTIQGWKKRGKIPAARREEILNFAAEHQIDLNSVFFEKERTVDVKPSVAKIPAAIVPDTVQVANENKSVDRLVEETGSQNMVQLNQEVEDRLMGMVDQRIKDMEKRVMTKSTLIAGLFVVLALGALMVMFWPSDKMTEDERLAALERAVQENKSAQNELAETQGVLAQVQAGLQERAQGAVSNLTQRASIGIEDGLDRLSQSGAMVVLSEHFGALEQTELGREQLRIASAEMSDLFTSLKGVKDPERVNALLEQARGQSAALSETFEHVPTQDLKAAAMLLAMNQLRQGLNRDNAKFEDDYTTLRNLVGDDNPELMASLDNLAPHVQSGVLTPGGLKEEFKSLSGEVLFASLKGEDISIQERAQARMNELVSLQKDGELVTGTDTQATLVRTENLLATGNIEAAIAQMQGLDGDAGAVASQWIQKAQGTLSAQKMKGMLNQVMRQGGYSSVRPYDFNKR